MRHSSRSEQSNDLDVPFPSSRNSQSDFQPFNMLVGMCVSTVTLFFDHFLIRVPPKVVIYNSAVCLSVNLGEKGAGVRLVWRN